jgi:hypothetical protein
MATLAKADRLAVYESAGGLCGICGDPVDFGHADIDHIEPRMHGGPDSAENLRPAHVRCNRRRGALAMWARDRRAAELATREIQASSRTLSFPEVHRIAVAAGCPWESARLFRLSNQAATSSRS